MCVMMVVKMAPTSTKRPMTHLLQNDLWLGSVGPQLASATVVLCEPNGTRTKSWLARNICLDSNFEAEEVEHQSHDLQL